jgi:hypothetical protein
MVRPGVPILVIGPATEDQAVLDALAKGRQGICQRIRPRIGVRQRDPCNQVRASSGLPPDYMLVDGRSNKEIAEPLGIEERTVKSHVAKLMRKVGVQNRIMLTVHAVNHCLVAAR